jgi:hypothetical protein
LRALWATAIVVCLLAVGGQPVKPDVHERDTTHLDVAVHAPLASLVRRSSGVDAHLRPALAILAVAPAYDLPPRVSIIIGTEPAYVHHDRLPLPTRSSRGPPLS